MQPQLFAGPVVRPAEPHRALVDLGNRLPARVFLGTSSWSFPGWAGQVWKQPYPESVLSEHGLGAYAAHPLLKTVSLDRTYYRMPDSDVLKAYAESVPEDFRFIVKAPAMATTPVLRGEPNPCALDPDWVRREVVARFRETLGDRLGLVLLQFPPGARFDRFGQRLQAVLALDAPWAVEVRNPEWMAEVGAATAATNTSPCLTIHPSMPDLRTQWKAMGAGRSEHLVVRWNLGGGQDYSEAKQRYAPFDRIVDPAPDVRAGIARAIDWAVARNKSVWITANNKAEGCAPRTLEAIANAWDRS